MDNKRATPRKEYNTAFFKFKGKFNTFYPNTKNVKFGLKEKIVGRGIFFHHIYMIYIYIIGK